MEKILFLVGILFLIVAIKILKQDFLSPAVINIYWNILFFIGAVIIFDINGKWKYSGLWWLLASCLAFLVGQDIGEKIRVRTGKVQIKRWKGYISYGLIFLIMLGICNSLLYLNAYGYSIKTLFNIKALLNLNTIIAYDRYIGHEVNLPSISVIFSMAIYLGAIIGGYIFQFTTKRNIKILSIASIFPILLLAIITNGKVGVVACSFLWITGWILWRLENSKEDINSITILRIIVIGGIGIAFLDFTMLLRIGRIDVESQLIVNRKLQEYAFGQIQAFSEWYSMKQDMTLGMGVNTYMFLPNWLGITKRIQGVYELIPGAISNIYTINRGIIEDYGKIGGIIYWELLGNISGILYKKICKLKKGNIIEITILGTIYFQIWHGFMVSPWVYSSYVLAFVGFAMFLWCIKKVR